MQHIEGKKAMLFDIQRFSVQDGPGIRTNLFFKGCPLRCIWCHNPESYRMEKQLSFLSKACTGCGSCAAVCPYGANALIRTDEGALLCMDHERCAACGECLKVCCYDARTMVGYEMTAKELADQVEMDRAYYAVRGAEGECGGITLTGGEPMLQAAFLHEFLDLLQGVHVCMETSGYAGQRDFAGLLPKIDLFLFDYKATDPEKHRRLCGVGNEKIRDNLEYLCREKADVILRLPLIPGINDDEEHLREIAALINRHPNIRYGEIMPYHTLGVAKAEQIGCDRPVVSHENATEEKKQEWLSLLRGYGAERIR